MTLTLRIENFDYLPDGGPLDVTVSERTLEVGRDSAMDWTLPDTQRHISSRHFEVVWRDGHYWINDLSTNGTFIYGQSMRISSPHQLSNNDRLQIGPYIIRVQIQETAASFAPPQATSGPITSGSATSGWDAPIQNTPVQSAPSADPWDIGGGSGEALPTPSPLPPPSRPASPLPGQVEDSFIEAPRPAPSQPHAPSGFQSPPPAHRPQSEPFAHPSQPAAPTPSPVAPQPQAGGRAEVLLNAICKGSGLPAGSLNGVDMNMLGEEIGRSLRITTEEMMSLLAARAAAKQLVKSGSRTMVGGLNNSPLKFKPNATEAMDTMFVRQTESYLSATDSLKQGFDDIKRHQTAIYAAMQPALARLLEDISPEAIAAKTSGGLVGSKKSRLWETFVERWDAKTHPHENGMLDVFLAYFAESYDEAVRKTGG